MTSYEPKPRQGETLQGERGFTFVEVLAAIVLLTIGLVGVGAVLVLQSRGVSSAASFGLAAVTRGNQRSIATMLAQARLEDIKNAQYTQITAANFPNEAYWTIPNYPNFRRTVTIQPDATLAMTTITVQVLYFAQLESGVSPNEESVTLATIIAQRP